ncbi:MAG TPA: hypothetical protein VKA91_06195 [Nitrososphaeraceae archaeon]|nr:hypothetical protein [Nitrososphaeraceae archaeon]
MVNINWNKLQTLSGNAITTLSNAIITQIPGISLGGSGATDMLLQQLPH